ncbi:MAG: 50S ribosomal protein L22 [Candidatus Sungbacteria bacterium]|nr:50S ribosomal protein L22 [Candidatus Sungbacteria bacterium]
MKISAELNYLRISPRKVRAVAGTIRGKRVPDAERTLRFISRNASGPVLKLLKSAVANAKNNFQVVSPETLVVSEITVNEGPTLKRRRPRAMGRAFPIRKRTSHLRIVLESSGAAVKKKIPTKAAIDTAGARGKVSEKEESKIGLDRLLFRAKPKTATKTTDFVKRMFRRKAI